MALMAGGIAASTIAMTIAPAAAASVRGSEWWLSELGVRQAWTTTKGSGVTVAVLSDGVDASQADLTGSVTSARNLVSGAPSSGQFFGQAGTGLASLIAGHGHGAGDASGIIGVAPQAKILSVPVTLPSTDPLLGQTSVAAALPGDIAAGIRYAVAHGASVIDLPIDPGQPAASGSAGVTAAAGGSSAERSAVSYALAHDVVLVAPAGDDGSGSDAANFPAAYQGVISVGAFDRSFAKAPWTSHQGYVTITAAGVNVTAATNDGGYQTFSSTSAASAIVAGMAALIRSRYPSLDVAQVRQALISGTRFHGSTAGSGRGTADAQLALAAAGALVPAGSPAGNGALPLVTQPTPAAAPQSLPGTLRRDGIISAALLIVLLLLTALYSTVSRRRTVRKQEAIAAEWTSRHQSRYPHAGTEGDRMLEYFAAPIRAPGTGVARIVQQPGKASPARTPVISGQGLFATANRQPIVQASGLPVRSRITGAPPAPAPWDEADTEVRPGPGLASREVDRRPAVAGTPPWGPAVQPDSDLPWAVAAAQDLDGGAAAFGQSDYASSVPAAGPPAVVPPRIAGTLAASGISPAPGAGSPALPGTFAGPAAITAGPAAVTANPRAAIAGRPSIAGGGPGSAIAAARAGVAAAAQEAQARRGSGQLDVAASPSGPIGPTGGSGSLWERNRPDQPSLAEPPAERTWPGVPAGDGLPGPSMTGGLDWRNDLAAPGSGGLSSPAAESASPSAYLPGSGPQQEFVPQEPGGPLPVRQPRHSTPAAAAPLSPSGSLWERAVDSGEQQDAGQGTGSRPIYVWDPGSPTDSYPTARRDSGGMGALEPADYGSQSAQWDVQPMRDSQPQFSNPPQFESQPPFETQPQPESQPQWDAQPPGNSRPPWDTQPSPWGNSQPPPWNSES